MKLFEIESELIDKLNFEQRREYGEWLEKNCSTNMYQRIEALKVILVKLKETHQKLPTTEKKIGSVVSGNVSTSSQI